MKESIDIVEDIKNALAKISSNAHKGLQSIKEGNSMEAYYHGQLVVIEIIGYIIQNGEQAEVKNEKKRNLCCSNN